ncbi:helix-turn-helix domain-containing protein [Sphingomonas profundi]|uniref:helix-turn-helix domain-containing protein n=1 Tax=Alterirhizorhabdus profundi TaxID=2681549 RepID=UPI0018D061D4|nr:helix-turn-helix transcriptional regulator [Sphingomonas profundi]
MSQAEDQFQSFLPTGVGERLRSAREAQGRDLDEIATITRIPLRHLRVIESGAHTDLPATPYSVGFVRTYAQAIGLDAAKLAQDFRAELGAAPVTQGVAEPFEPADPKRVPSRLLAAVALLIAVLLAGGYAVLRSGTLSGEDPEARARLAAGTATVPAATPGAPPRPARPRPVPPGRRRPPPAWSSSPRRRRCGCASTRAMAASGISRRC